MEALAVVTTLMLIEYFVFSALVGKARVQHKIDAPSTSGPEEFDRYFRVHQNTLEQLIMVIPAMWIFGFYVNQQIAAGLGLLFIVGRILYMRGYVTEPAKRGAGFGVGILATGILILGGLVGAILTWLK